MQEPCYLKVTLPRSAELVWGAQAEASAPAAGSTGSSVAAYKVAAAATIDEYFASGEAGEVVRRLVELDEPALANIFLKQVRCQQYQSSRHFTTRRLQNRLTRHVDRGHGLHCDVLQ